MSLIAKKDIDLLLGAGFEESDLGLVSGSKRGVEIYETPENYFARELIENACEQGECDLAENIADFIPDRQRYDDSRKGLYDDTEYPGFDDPLVNVQQNLREQVKWLRTVKLGKLNIWQKRKDGRFLYQVTDLNVEIPEDEKERMKRLTLGDKKTLWITYAKEEWKKCWQATVDSIWSCSIEGKLEIRTKKGKQINLLIIPADNLREVGYENLPYEARWITMLYFVKDNMFKRR